MTRIELDEADCGSVGRVREGMSRAQQVDTGSASRTELLRLLGDAWGGVDILLRVIDGGESR
ncbi:hypothetical protein [Streptomyces luteogriseus]|uniref:hypothetical protein n=1 Tax=Streptomyces luteogriseus TaxID=68233 RepID=UPI003828AE5F